MNSIDDHRPVASFAHFLSRLKRTGMGLLALCAMIGNGCHTSRTTEPARTASELLLLSHSTDHAIHQMDLAILSGKRVYVDQTYFESVDKAYVQGAVREKVTLDGAVLVSKSEEAEYVVEVRNRGLGMDTRTSLFGLPAMDIPIPFAGQVQSPELALFKAQMADGIASFALAVYRKEDGLRLSQQTAGAGESKLNQYQLLGLIKWRSTDVPELKSTSAQLKQRMQRNR